MTIKITPEAVKERIAALESAGEISLKEQFYLEALRQLVASVGSYPVALQPELANYPPAPPAPVVPDELLKEYLRLVSCMLSDYRDSNYGDAQRWIRHIADASDTFEEKHGLSPWEMARKTCRAAMLQHQPQNAQQNIPEIIPDSCTWTFSNYDDHWSGTCGAEWVFNDGGPEENGVKFCPKCGKSVAISATE